MISIRSALQIIASRYLSPGRCICPICEKSSGFFLPSPNPVPPLLKELGGVGGNPDAFQCVWCGSSDRERHLWLYLGVIGREQVISDADVLHFAPEKRLSKKIQQLKPKSYIKADLFPDSSDIERVDILETSFDENQFDVVIANHVLEHVDNDTDAIVEIARILKVGGIAVLQTPYCELLEKTWSDPGVKSKKARLIAYGQEDHVRLFGIDIESRFSSSGLNSEMARHEDLLPDKPPEIYGVNSKEPLFLFRKSLS